MTTDIEQAKAIFLTAVENYQPEQWPAYLDGACGDDARLRSLVQQLLKAHAELGTFQGKPGDNLEATEDHDLLPDAVGTTIGPYKLLQPVGEGGFGVVYMAEQQEPVRRKVALKIIKPGMDTKEVIARFEAERQALAVMDHPHIAKVLDAGATGDGRPYFVMEFVKGVPVTEFCDKNNFSTRQRLELFTTVCNAVQHAHQKGVIHRDLKPSNVMVTLHDGKPVVKVIDFGVSKAISQRLTEKTLFTRYGQMVGTPQYMSPEQAEMSGLDVDTRSDIYSLGVLLYELLTGTTPLEGKQLRAAGYAEMVRLILEEEAPTPSHRLSTLKERLSIVCQQRSADERRLHQQLQGDLDWIVMRALEKDRSRRYETASAFAEDITRHLNDEPVLASPPSAAYRLRKFVRRKRGLVVAAFAIAGALIVGFTAAVVGFVQANEQRNQAQMAQRVAEEARAEAERQRIEAHRQGTQAQQERDQAEHQQQRAESVLALMKQMLSSASLSAERPRNYTVRQMLDDFSETLDVEFEENSEVGADIWLTIGEVYHSIEEIERASRARHKGLELARTAYKDEPVRLEPHLRFLAYDLTDVSRIEIAFLHAKEAELLLREAVEIHEQLEKPPELVVRDEVNSRMVLGWSLMLQYRFDDAETAFREAIEVQKQLSPGEEFAYVALANCLRWHDRERLGEAIGLLDKAIPCLRNALTHGEQGDTARRRWLHLNYALAIKGMALWDQARIQEADIAIAEALEMANSAKEYAVDVYVGGACARSWSLIGLGNTQAGRDLLMHALEDCRKAGKKAMEMRVLHNLAAISILDDNVDHAEQQLKTALDISVARFGSPHVYTTLCRFSLAQHYELVGLHDKSESLYFGLIDDIEGLLKQSSQNPVWLVDLFLAKSHSSASTEADLYEAIEMAGSALTRVARFRKCRLQLAIAKAHIRLGHFQKAIDDLRKGLEERWATPGWLMPAYESLTIERELIRLLMDHGTVSEIEEAFRHAIEDRERYFTATHPATLDAKVQLANWLIDQDRVAEASELLDVVEQLAEHAEASRRRKRLAMETAIKLRQALSQPAPVEANRIRSTTR